MSGNFYSPLNSSQGNFYNPNSTGPDSPMQQNTNSNSSSSSSSSSNSSRSSQQQSALPGFSLAFSCPPPSFPASGPAEPRLDRDRMVDTVFMDEIGKMTSQHQQRQG